MANDFSSVASELTASVLNSHPSTAALIKEAMVRTLQALQPEIVPFMEKSGSFSTVARQATYTAADAGFPLGLLRFERLGYDMGNYYRPLEVAPMDTIRMLQEHPAIEYPFRVAWWEERLQFGPAPAGVYTVKWDATLDATKDTATGALITTASTTQTNAWFLLPQVAVLKHFTWWDYFTTSPDQRPDLAASHQQLATMALARLRETGQKREEMASTYVVGSAYERYSPDRSRAARVSRLFPGAPV